MKLRDLSIRFVDLRNVAEVLSNKATAPKGMMQEVGEHNGKFYMIDWVTGRISRLTRGAFQHLHQSWDSRQQIMA